MKAWQVGTFPIVACIVDFFEESTSQMTLVLKFEWTFIVNDQLFRFE